MKKLIAPITVALAVVLFVVPAVAQQSPPAEQGAPPQPRRTPGPPLDPLMNAFPPEMIMQHQRELGLTDQQKTFMRTEIGKTSARFNDLQWQLHDAMEALQETMKLKVVNEQQALAQLDRVLDSEREIKRLHMELAIKIKNNLTPEQQEKLHGFRQGHGPGMGVGHGPGQGPGSPPARRPGPGVPPGPIRPEFQ